MKKLLIFFVFLACFFLNPFSSIKAQEKESFSFVYFTGIGCPHCAEVDPFVLEQLPRKYPNLIIFEYEIYQKQDNAPLLYQYNQKYNSDLGVPLAIFGENDFLIGDSPILKNIEEKIKTKSNQFPSLQGKINFGDLNLSAIPGRPTIWSKERVLIKTKNQQIENDILKNLLLKDDLSLILESIDYEIIKPEKVPLSGKNLNFQNAIKINNWIFQWNGSPIISDEKETEVVVQPQEEIKEPRSFTLAKIISLATVDAINPCALAVLTLILLAVLTYSPKKKKDVLLAGLLFSLAVFIMYLFYGLIIIKSFQLIQALTSIRILLYKILGGTAVIIGILNIKDFIKYKPGGFLTEMPLWLRPKMQNFLFKITSPKGAFVIGALVTLFLLPCTIGPYIITGGILSSLALMKTIPWLLLYNIIFILPMVAITFICYISFTTVENVSGWKDKNIRYLHLISGLIIFLLGLAMVLGWI